MQAVRQEAREIFAWWVSADRHRMDGGRVMPTLKRACSYQLCSSPAVRGSNYCAEHARVAKQAHRSAYDARRPKTAARGYDARWRKIRLMQLRAEPLCVSCGGAATEVDHITPLAAGGTHAFSNLQSMCKSCHSSKTGQRTAASAARDRARGRGFDERGAHVSGMWCELYAPSSEEVLLSGLSGQART